MHSYESYSVLILHTQLFSLNICLLLSPLSLRIVSPHHTQPQHPHVLPALYPALSSLVWVETFCNSEATSHFSIGSHHFVVMRKSSKIGEVRETLCDLVWNLSLCSEITGATVLESCFRWSSMKCFQAPSSPTKLKHIFTCLFLSKPGLSRLQKKKRKENTTELHPLVWDTELKNQQATSTGSHLQLHVTCKVLICRWTPAGGGHAKGKMCPLIICFLYLKFIKFTAGSCQPYVYLTALYRSGQNCADCFYWAVPFRVAAPNLWSLPVCNFYGPLQSIDFYQGGNRQSFL